jgi:hypothetical protein
LWCVGEFGDLLVAADKPNDVAKGDDESISITVRSSLSYFPIPSLTSSLSLGF